MVGFAGIVSFKNDVLFFLHDLFPPDIVDFLVQKINQVDGVFIQTVHEDVGGIQVDGNLNLWPALMKLADQIRENGGADGFDGADA